MSVRWARQHCGEGAMIIEADGLLGREQEVAAISRFLATIEERPAARLLDGEPGIGKTALVGHAVDEARRRGYRILAARPTSAESSLSFVGLTDLLSDARELFAELPMPQRRALEIALLLDEGADATPDPRAIGMGLLGVLRGLAASSPVLVAVDDLQWFDGASAAALSFALRRLTNEPLGLLAALRKDTNSPATELDRIVDGERVALGPLSMGAIHALLVGRLQLSIPRSLLLRIHEACGGNPLFALEVGRALQERGLPEPGQPFEIPADAETLFTARLAQLPLDTLDALAVAAASAAPSRLFVSTASTGALEPAIRANIIRLEGDRIHFTHPLLASAVYARLDATARRELHRRIATAVSDREERARHLALAAEEPDRDVAVALDDAAEQASRRGASAAACELAELAVKLTPPHDTGRLRVRRRLAAERHRAAGDIARSRRILERLIPELPPGTERAQALLRLAELRDDDLAANRPMIEQAIADAVGDDRVLAVALRHSAMMWMLTGSPERAVAQAREAATVAERTADARLLAQTLACEAFFEMGNGRITSGLLEKAVELERQAGYLRFYESPAMLDGLRLMLLEDDLDAARVRLAQAERVARDHGDDEFRALLLSHLAEVECRAGRLDDAARYATEGYELGEQFGGGDGEGLFRVAFVEAARGHTEAALAAAERGRASCEKAGNEIFALRNLAVLGLVALSLGDAPTAAETLAPLSEQLAARGHGRLTMLRLSGLPDAIEALTAVGEHERAAVQLEWLDETARLGIPYARARAARCHGLLAAAKRDYAAAFDAFDDALVAHERLPDPVERGRTLLTLGQTQRRAGRRREARETLQQGLAIFEELGARLWAQQAQTELARLGGRTPSGRALTGAEERVARLVAEGKTNREVAAALFVTERTVETHLSSIYRKLDLRSRSELAGHLAGRTS
ncbi:MAG TPA: AAA family ATPase [Gaiellaceae bacterium]